MAGIISRTSSKMMLLNGTGVFRCIQQYSCVTHLRTANVSQNHGAAAASHIKGFHTSRAVSDTFTIQDEKDFQAKVKNNKKPVVVQFHASWCGPCKMLGPRLDKVMINFKDSIDMAKLDIEDLPDIAMEYNVGAVPSVLLLKDGNVIDKFVGLKEEDQIETFLKGASKK